MRDRLSGLQQVAALASNDLSYVVQQLQRSDRDLEGLSGASLVQRSERVAAMIRYWLSDTATAARPYLAV